MNESRQPEREEPNPRSPITVAEEQLVVDPRGGLSPSQQVDRKLMNALQRSPLLVSRLNSSRLVLR